MAKACAIFLGKDPVMFLPWPEQTPTWWRVRIGKAGTQETAYLYSQRRRLQMDRKLSHYDETGQVSMVDVGSKKETERTALASAFVAMSKSVLDHLPSNPKGNPLEVARIAGIM